ncbi:hypothetical protein DLD77_05430 [Chitinophaga alhagiae]|uniref:Methyltransferase type 11 domain-containing protein n=1 Tax=Chitinophaga alhagiae TaxID=2203219 RepID=A0ABM6WB38_9BACT|nr:class I SAM-dependent methyltransferase [Chitinophaga alhagiae]AWO01170.1 hypothetical protein DLD77_05430 [Chitinophaga alhagiae]
MLVLLKILRKIKHAVAPLFTSTSSIKYWEKRAKQYGARSVIHLGHSEEELAAITQKQQNILFPLLQKELKGDEKLLLDLGCGPGRFTHDLAVLCHCQAVGIDPIQHLLDIAPASPLVNYNLMKEGIIPLDDNSVNITWICLVLGSVTNMTVLEKTVSEVLRVTKPGGLVFLVEKTSEDLSNYKTKTVAFYESSFKVFNLRKIEEYQDLEDCNSIFIGRKP